MDEREYYREDIDTVRCTECGQAHLRCSEGLLEGMELSALSEAQVRLSEKGWETLQMVGRSSEKLPGGWIEAWNLAYPKNISRLPNDDVGILEVYGSRITLIERAREELNEDTFARD